MFSFSNSFVFGYWILLILDLDKSRHPVPNYDYDSPDD